MYEGSWSNIWVQTGLQVKVWYQRIVRFSILFTHTFCLSIVSVIKLKLNFFAYLEFVKTVFNRQKSTNDV